MTSRVRRFSRYFGSFLIAGWCIAGGSGCVSSARPAPGSGITAPPGPGGQPPGAKPEVPVVPVVAPPPETTPPRPRLAWLNPARCLTACAFVPTPDLVRINGQGVVDAKGRFQIVAETQVALIALLQAAHAAGHELRVNSAFRSYADQARVFADIKEPGRAARPGHSEHQLGTVADLRLPTTAAIDWLAAHAPEFGFALSYPPNKQKITGYRPEPWHVRFVGRELAEELHGKKMLLEEYFRSQPSAGESGTCADCPLATSQAACGEATAEGSCAGTLLTWCYDGALATVDCATSDQKCGAVAGGAGYDCLPKAVAGLPTEPEEPSARAASIASD